MNIIEDDLKLTMNLWVSMISLNIGALDIPEFESFLDKETLKDNPQDIILELQFNLSKGINYITRELNIYLHSKDVLADEKLQFLVEDLIIGIMKRKLDSKYIDIFKFSQMAYRLCLYYHPEPPMVFADDYYNINRTKFHEINNEIMNRAKYYDWCFQVAIYSVFQIPNINHVHSDFNLL